MTLNYALDVLIESAARDIKGSGMGYRDTTEAHRKEVREAIKRVWEYRHKRPIEWNEKFNLGI